MSESTEQKSGKMAGGQLPAGGSWGLRDRLTLQGIGQDADELGDSSQSLAVGLFHPTVPF